MNSSLDIIKDGGRLTEALEVVSQDKLVVLFFYTKANPQCKYAAKTYEQLAGIHTLSAFYIVDMDRFDGDPRIFNSITNTPYFEFYYQGNKMDAYVGSESKDLDQKITAIQKHIMIQTNQKHNLNQNFSRQNQSDQNQIAGQTFSQNSQQLYQQIQQNILSTTASQNPALHKQLVQNSQQLHQAVVQQMAGAGQNQGQPQFNTQPIQYGNQTPQQNSFNNVVSGQFAPQSSIPMQSVPNQFSVPEQLILQQSQSTPQAIIPTIQQMQYMFQIWETMNQMGILKTNVQPKPIPADKNSLVAQTVGQEIILPSGDKLIPLGNNKYGLKKRTI